MCFSKGAIGCCKYNIRRYDAEGRTLWLRRWNAGYDSILGDDGGLYARPVPFHHAVGPEGAIAVVGGQTGNGHHLRIYSVGGEIVVAKDITDDIPPPSSSERRIRPAAVAWSADNIVVAVNTNDTTPTPTGYLLRYSSELEFVEVLASVGPFRWLSQSRLSPDGLAWFGGQGGSGSALYGVDPAGESTTETVDTSNFSSSFDDDLWDFEIAAEFGITTSRLKRHARPQPESEFPGLAGVFDWANNKQPNSVALLSDDLIATGSPSPLAGGAGFDDRQGARTIRLYDADGNPGATWPVDYPTTGINRGTSRVVSMEAAGGVIGDLNNRLARIDGEGVIVWIHANSEGNLQTTLRPHEAGEITVSIPAELVRTATNEFVDPATTFEP